MTMKLLILWKRTKESDLHLTENKMLKDGERKKE